MAGYVFPDDASLDSPWSIFQRVLGFPELELQASLIADHEVRFAFALRYDGADVSWMKQGRRVLGMAHMPRVSGQLSDLFDQLLMDTLGFEPDFLIILNGEWWQDANDVEREVLVFHELKHCGQAMDLFGAPKFKRDTGAPILSMVAHDVEEFEDVARRYGAWKSDLRSFVAALDEGPRRANGGPGDGFADAMSAMRDVLGDLAEKGITMSVSAPRPALVDGELPPNVNNADRDNPSQAESAADLF